MDLAQIAAQIASGYIAPTTGRPAEIAKADVVQELLEAVQNGNYLETAADLAGISDNTVRNWMKRGEAGEPPFDLFFRAVKRAEARAESESVKRVRAAGNDPRFWAADMTFLERRKPERWARRSDTNDGPKVVVQIGVKDSDVQVSVQGAAPPAIGSGEND